MSRIVLSLLVDNTAGVLSRVAGLFSRRGYNIESLTVGVTADPRYSRMTVVSLGDHQVLEQIQKQLGKLEDVHDIKELREGHSVYRELMLVKVRANANQRMAINAISEIFRASIVDVGKDSVTVMLTGDQSKQDALINENHHVVDLTQDFINVLGNIKGVVGRAGGIEQNHADDKHSQRRKMARICFSSRFVKQRNCRDQRADHRDKMRQRASGILYVEFMMLCFNEFRCVRCMFLTRNHRITSFVVISIK